MLREIELDLLLLSPRRAHVALPKLTPSELTEANEFGILRPVVARPLPNTSHSQTHHYEIVANIKSWILAQRLGLRTVPVYIREDLPENAAITETAEGLPRNPLEAAAEANDLRKEQSAKISHLANKFGCDRSSLSHQLRLLRLAKQVQSLLAKGALRVGHVKPLVSLPMEQQVRLAHEIMKKKLSVRAVEELVRSLRTAGEALPPAEAKLGKDPDTALLEKRLSESIGCKVELKNGRLIINYENNLDVLDGVLQHLGYVSV